MSGINWMKDAERRRVQRQGVEDKSHQSKDALRREADRLLAGYTGPVERVPAGITTHPPSTVRFKRKVASTPPKSSKTSTGKLARFATAIPPGLVVYCDGACEPNPGIGGWGFVVYRDGVEIHSDCGGETVSTNNIMEMTGALMALKWIAAMDAKALSMDGKPRLLCDSQYVVNGCNEWRHSWKRNGWNKRSLASPKRADGEIRNLDLWKELDAVLTVVPITLEWVKGHVGIVGNERADELSLMGREAAFMADASDGVDMIAEQLRYVVAL